jgi:hypothetical protein
MSNPNVGKDQVWSQDLSHAKDSVKAVPYAGGATVATIASAATSAQMVAANTARNTLILSNSDANAFYGRFGTTDASASAFSIIIPANETRVISPAPTDALQGIWAADGSGYLGITELSA